MVNTGLKVSELTKLENIRNELSKYNVLEKMFNFACYNDHIFTYTYEDNDFNMFEISFIAEDTLLDEMTAIDLINIANKQYFDIRIFNNDEIVIYTEMYNINHILN